MIDLPGRESRLRKALAGVQKDYDFIFIDCPPSLDLLTLNGLSACDSVLIRCSASIMRWKSVGAHQHPQDHPQKVQPLSGHRGRGVHDVLPALQPHGAGGGAGAEVFRLQGVQNHDPAFDPHLRGPQLRAAHQFLRAKGKGSEAYMDLAIEFVKNNRPHEPKKTRARSKSAPEPAPVKNALED